MHAILSDAFTIFANPQVVADPAIVPNPPRTLRLRAFPSVAPGRSPRFQAFPSAGPVDLCGKQAACAKYSCHSAIFYPPRTLRLKTFPSVAPETSTIRPATTRDPIPGFPSLRRDDSRVSSTKNRAYPCYSAISANPPRALRLKLFPPLPRPISAVNEEPAPVLVLSAIFANLSARFAVIAFVFTGC